MENRGQGGVRWTDDITAPTARTRFASVQQHLPWVRDKQSASPTPSAEGSENVNQAPVDAPAGGAECTAHGPGDLTNSAESVHENAVAPEQEAH